MLIDINYVKLDNIVEVTLLKHARHWSC